MKQIFKKSVSFLLAFVMVLGVFTAMPFAAAIDYAEEDDDFYKVISKKNWELAPGVLESEIVINNDAGDRRQVMHVVEVDIHNEYTKVIPSSKGMIPTAGQYGVQTMDKQAEYAEANGYGNVVAAMNISLSWYDSTYYDAHPELVGEPLGYLILDGVQYTNSQGKTSGAQTCLVINFDEKDGVARPADIPKTQIRATSEAITGWEEQVIPANFGFLVKDGKMVYTKEEHTSEGASRSMLGIKEDGSIVMVMNDGRQAPYSTGFNNYEMSEAMLKLGCVYAINGDGGGSSQFLSQRPGEELTVNCSPSDGGLRATTHGVLVISSAPSTGEFVRAHVEADNDYYTPGSKVKFKATGADLAGAAAEIPEDAYWQLSDATYGTIDDNGVFVSNGTLGEVTAQLVYNDEVKGSASINIVNPDAIAFGTAEAYTVPFGESVKINVTATYGVFDVTLKPEDYTITFSDDTLGTLDGNSYTAGNVKGTADMTVTLNADTNVSKTIPLSIGKGSEVIFSFEEGTEGANLDNWLIKDHEGKYTPYSDISIVNAENGMVHNGNTALAVHMPTHQHVDGGEGYNANSITWVGDPILLENATAIGMWVYIPEEATQTEIALNYVWYNDQGVQQRTTPDLCLNDYFNGIESSGWYYLSVPVSKAVAYIEDATEVASKQGYKRNFFLKFYVTNSGNAGDETSYSGDITYYIDDVTVDYSDAVADRIKPTIKATYVKNISADADVTLTAGSTPSLSNGEVSFFAEVSDNIAIDAASAKVFVDGKEVSATCKNGRITSADVNLGVGTHRVVYEIADMMGNSGSAVRYVSVAGTEKSVDVVPQNPDATVAYTGSVYWVDVVADNAENIEKITLKLDLDTMNTWQLDNADLAYNFDIEYYYASIADKNDNLVTVVLTNNGSDVNGKSVIASLPIRVWSYCGNAASSNITPAEAWTKGYVTAVSVNVEVEQGEVFYKDSTSATFSAEKIHIDTEAYTHQYKMDKTYYANNTYHVHTVSTLDDLDATCTKNGYSGRTFCEACASVIEWGTTVSATGHSYAVIGNKLACACDSEFVGIGLQMVDGKNYYVVNGTLLSGWIDIDGEWYYFDNTTFAGLDGEQYTEDAIKFSFDNGRLLKGTWTRNSNGLRYWYGPGYYRDTSTEITSCRPYEIDGKTYLFNRAGYMQTGIVRYYNGTTGGGNSVLESLIYYDCGTDGVAVLYTGVYDGYFYIDGRIQKAYQLVQDNDGNIYFVNDGHKVAKDVTIYLAERFVEGHTYADGTPMTAGYFTFDSEGKLVVKNGVIDGYLYVNGVQQKAYKLVEYNGDYYFVNDGHKVAKDMTIYLAERFVEGHTYADGTPMTAGYFTFDSEGKLVSESLKNGVIDGYLYIDGVKQTAYKLVKYNGDYYFVNDGHKVAKNMTIYLAERFVEGHTYADGTPMTAGYFTFDSEGKLVVKNGVVGDYLYINGVQQKAYKLVKYNGDYYFVNDGHKVAKDMTIYLAERFVEGHTYADGTPMTAGYFTFDSEGKLVVKNGVVGDYLYINGVQQQAYKLVKYNGDYYFVNDGHKVAKNMTIYLAERFVEGHTYDDGEPMKAGYYTFDSEGKLVVKNGVVGDYFYHNGVQLKAYQLVEYNGDFYFINDYHKVLKNSKIWLSAKYVSGKTFSDGSVMEAGYYYFDENGKMVY